MSLSPEDQARADFYGLIARLLYAAPDQQLISELVRAPALEGAGALATAWREMVDECRSAGARFFLEHAVQSVEPFSR